MNKQGNDAAPEQVPGDAAKGPGKSENWDPNNNPPPKPPRETPGGPSKPEDEKVFLKDTLKDFYAAIGSTATATSSKPAMPANIGENDLFLVSLSLKAGSRTISEDIPAYLQRLPPTEKQPAAAVMGIDLDAIAKAINRADLTYEDTVGEEAKQAGHTGASGIKEYKSPLRETLSGAQGVLLLEKIFQAISLVTSDIEWGPTSQEVGGRRKHLVTLYPDTSKFKDDNVAEIHALLRHISNAAASDRAAAILKRAEKAPGKTRTKEHSDHLLLRQFVTKTIPQERFKDVGGQFAVSLKFSEIEAMEAGKDVVAAVLRGPNLVGDTDKKPEEREQAKKTNGTTDTDFRTFEYMFYPPDKVVFTNQLLSDKKIAETISNLYTRYSAGTPEDLKKAIIGDKKIQWEQLLVAVDDLMEAASPALKEYLSKGAKGVESWFKSNAKEPEQETPSTFKPGDVLAVRPAKTGDIPGGSFPGHRATVRSADPVAKTYVIELRDRKPATFTFDAAKEIFDFISHGKAPEEAAAPKPEPAAAPAAEPAPEAPAASAPAEEPTPVKKEESPKKVVNVEETVAPAPEASPEKPKNRVRDAITDAVQLGLSRDKLIANLEEIGVPADKIEELLSGPYEKAASQQKELQTLFKAVAKGYLPMSLRENMTARKAGTPEEIDSLVKKYEAFMKDHPKPESPAAALDLGWSAATYRAFLESERKVMSEIGKLSDEYKALLEGKEPKPKRLRKEAYGPAWAGPTLEQVGSLVGTAEAVFASELASALASKYDYISFPSLVGSPEDLHKLATFVADPLLTDVAHPLTANQQALANQWRPRAIDLAHKILSKLSSGAEREVRPYMPEEEVEMAAEDILLKAVQTVAEPKDLEKALIAGLHDYRETLERKGPFAVPSFAANDPHREEAAVEVYDPVVEMLKVAELGSTVKVKHPKHKDKKGKVEEVLFDVHVGEKGPEAVHIYLVNMGEDSAWLQDDEIDFEK